MRRENLYYSQLSEALKYTGYGLFAYKRLSLILLDNIVENLLKDKVIDSAGSRIVFDKITKTKVNKIVSSLNYFENITKYSKEFDLIQCKEKPLLDFCRSARNNAYHHLYEEEKVVDCCIYILFEFILKNIQSLIDFGVYAVEKEERCEILKIHNFKSIDDLFESIKLFIKKQKRPSAIFSDTLVEYINDINEFFEYEANEEWSNFNSILKMQYLKEIKVKDQTAIYRKPDVRKSGCIKHGWKDFENKNLTSIITQSYKLNELTTIEAFEKYLNLHNRIYPYYLLLRFYFLERENEAYLLED